MSTTWTNVNGGATVIPSDPGYISYTITADNNPLVLTWPDSVLTTLNNSVASTVNLQTTLVGTAVCVMPDATQASVGYTIIISNTGAQPVTINNFSGGFLVSIVPTQYMYFQLTDNTTDTGVWEIVTFGAATSSANASNLAGFGLTAFNSKLNTNVPVVSKSSSYSPTVNDRGTFFVYTGGTNNWILPDPSTTNIGDGYYFAVTNTSTIGGVLTIVNSFGYIDVPGETTLTISPGTSTNLISDGNGNYFTLGIGTETFFTYAAINIDVSGSGSLTLTNEQATRQLINFTGTLTGAKTVVFPNFIYEWFVYNNTSGAFTLTVESTVGVSTIVLTQGSKYILGNNGTDIYLYPSIDTDQTGLKYILQQANAVVAPNAQSLGTLTTGLLKNTVANSVGVLSTAVNGTDYLTNPVPNILFAVNPVIPTPPAGQMYMQLNEPNNVTFITSTQRFNWVLQGGTADNWIFGTPSALTSGTQNTIINPYANLALSTGANNAFYGTGAGSSTSTGSNNVGMGVVSLGNVTTGNNNIGLGYQSLNNITIGNANIGIGVQALAAYNPAPGGVNIAIGHQSQESVTASFNVTVGYQTLNLATTATQNTVIGHEAGQNITTGSNNVLIGFQAGQFMTTGVNNFIGFESGQNTTTGSGNVANGPLTLNTLTTGNNNTAGGYNSLNLIKTSSNNTAYGSGAGATLLEGSSGCTFIGVGADQTGGNALTNSGAIGNGAQVSANGTLVIGGNGTRVVLGDTNSGTSAESLNLMPAHGSSGLYMGTSPASRTIPASGSILFTDANSKPAVASTAIAGTYANIDYFPQPYYYWDLNITSFPIDVLSASSEYVECQVSNTLKGILHNGYPGGYYPNAVVVVETSMFFASLGGPASLCLGRLEFTKNVSGTQTTYSGVPTTTSFEFQDNNGDVETIMNLKMTVLLSAIVDPAATGWGFTIFNDGGDPFKFTGFVNTPWTCYIITGGIVN